MQMFNGGWSIFSPRTSLLEVQGWRSLLDLKCLKLYPGPLLDSRDGSVPVESPRRRRLARRPGYMRSVAASGVRFLAPAGGTSCLVPRGLTGKEVQQSESRAGQCGLDLSGQCQGLTGSPIPKSSPAPAVTSVGLLHLDQNSVRETPVHFGIQPGAGTRLSARLTRPCGPGDSGHPKVLCTDSSEVCGPNGDAALSEGARGMRIVGSLASREVSGNRSSLERGPDSPPVPPASQVPFASSFSFIQLSLGSAGERGEAEGCLPSRDDNSPQETGGEAFSSDQSLESPQGNSWAFGGPATRGPVGLAQAAGSSSKQQCGLHALTLDTGSFSPDPALAGGWGDEGSTLDVHSWDALLRQWEPALHDCLLSNRRRLGVTSLSLKLQKLQEKAIEDEDYDKAEMLRQRLEDLEQEKGRLPWALPSRQPPLGSFLGDLAAHIQTALQGPSPPSNSDDPEAPLRGDQRPLEASVQDSLHAAIARRDWLLQEKQQLQKEIGALQARLSALEAKEQQLRREIENQETPLQWQGCDLTPLVAQLSLSQLQEVSKALQDTLASASQVPFQAEPPGTIRSLQERTKSLNLAIKEITAQVCTSERLCSSLRRRLADLEARLPALLEAKMLAISGSHFCTAKELSEEIQALASEQEGLEALHSRLLALSSRSHQRLGSVKDDYSRWRRELAHQAAAHKASLKESTMKYMGTLGEKLRSCRCPLLGRVWEADLEACRLLMQSLELQEAGSSLCAEEEPVDSRGETSRITTAPVPSTCHCDDERKTTLQTFHEQKVHLAPSPHCTGSEQKEEPSIISVELGDKCEAIGMKLMHLEDQLHTAAHSQDEDLFQSLRGELQMVKETLQTMILQLQPAKEAVEGEAVASCPPAGAWEAQAEGSFLLSSWEHPA